MPATPLQAMRSLLVCGESCIWVSMCASGSYVYLLDVGSVNNDQIMEAVQREEQGRCSQADHEASLGEAGRRGRRRGRAVAQQLLVRSTASPAAATAAIRCIAGAVHPAARRSLRGSTDR